MSDGSTLSAWPRWLDRDAAARYLSQSPDKLRRLVKAGKLPTPSYHMGPKSPLWDREVLDAVLAGKVASRQPEVPLAEAVSALAFRLAQGGRRRSRGAEAPR
jgi:hypothetical protein